MRIGLRTVLCAAPLAVAIAGCGDAQDTSAGATTSINQASATQARAKDVGRGELVATLKRALKLREYAGVSNAYRVASGWCSIDAVLDSPASVKLYANAGDAVATNPGETLGAKIGTFEGVKSADCVRAAVSALASL